jgi:two-component system cell cycle response regulator CtrA
MRILHIDGDATTLRAVGTIFEDAGAVTHSTSYGSMGVEFSVLYNFDIMLLSLDLPDMEGYGVIRSLRNARSTLPILVLTKDDSTESKIKAFALGADDYLTKPFSREELVARTSAIVRRSRGLASDIITVGRLSVDIDNKMVQVGGVTVPLTVREYEVCEYMALNRGITLTKEMFLDRLYAGRDEPMIKIIDVFICKLRQKLDNYEGAGRYIETVWGRGYRLVDDNPN